MHVIHGYNHVPLALRGAAIAIGNFDGVHRGHQALLREAIAQGHAHKSNAGAMIFEPHPREFFQPKEMQFRLTSLVQKLALFERIGLDLAVVIPFDVTIASLGPDDFVERVLVAGLGVRHVVVGYDFFFGKSRAGTPESMRAAGATLGFGVSVLAPVAESGAAFSSTAVRLLLTQGDVKGAAHALGHWWRVGGKVVGGRFGVDHFDSRRRIRVEIYIQETNQRRCSRSGSSHAARSGCRDCNAACCGIDAHTTMRHTRVRMIGSPAR